MKSLSRRKRLGRASIVNHIALGQSKSCKNDKNKEYNKYNKKKKTNRREYENKKRLARENYFRECKFLFLCLFKLRF